MSHPDHSKYCHCICTDLYYLQAAIETARAIHLKPEPRDKCIMCEATDGSCDNCKWVKNCLVCNEEWPCDTFTALDYEA